MKFGKVLGLFTAMLMISSAFAGCGKKEEESSESVAENTAITSIADLSGKKIGTQLGTTGYIYAADIENASVSPYKTGEDAVSALVNGSIDAVLIDVETANFFVGNNSSLKILDEPFTSEEYSIAYKIGNDELGKKLDDAVSELKSDGTLEEIRKHWVGNSADQISYEPQADADRSNGKLVMATNAEFPPYESVDDATGNVVGFDVDMMNAVCDKLGMELEVININFNDIILSVNNGTADVGVAGISVTPGREKNVSFTQSYAETTQVVIVRK